MIREAIDRLIEISGGQLIQAHGKAYSTKPLNELRAPESQPEPITLHTLSGFVEFINDFATEGRERMILVDGPHKVTFCSDLYGEFEQRDEYAVAVPFIPGGFPFGQFMDAENFVIRLQSCFVQDETTRALLQIVGNIKGASVGTVSDDGVTQTVEARKGITRVENVALPNPVTLRPFRTFQEIEQPASRFVLRMTGNGTEMPKVALFEAEDNQWKLEALKSIAAFVSENVHGVKAYL